MTLFTITNYLRANKSMVNNCGYIDEFGISIRKISDTLDTSLIWLLM